MIKKLIAILLAAVMLLCLAACGGDKKPSEDPTTQPSATVPDATEAPTDENIITHDFSQFGSGRIAIVGSELIEDEDGEDLLRVYYDYTNTGDTAIGQCPSTALEFEKITQDGNELDTGHLYEDDPAHIPEDSLSVYVQPGCTIRQTLLIPVDPDGGVVSIGCYLTVGSWFFDKDDIQWFTFEIDPQDLMGAPAKALEIPSIMDSTYTKGMPTEGTDMDTAVPFGAALLEKYDIVDHEQEEGMKALRVYCTFTNHHEESWPASVALPINAYQDGISLEMGSTFYLSDPTVEDETFESVQVATGETVSCSALFILRNDHPVDIVVEHHKDGMRLGTVCEVAPLLTGDPEDEPSDEPQISPADLTGSWIDNDSDWMDTFTFAPDGTGVLVSGPEFPYTYTISGTTLTLTYDDDDSESFEVRMDGADLIMVDEYGEEVRLVRVVEEAPTTEATEPPTEAVTEDPYVTEILGTWVDEESGYQETFVFDADGTGMYSYMEDGVVYEYPITYSFLRSDYLQFFYEDGSEGGFVIRIEGDILYVTNDAVVDMPLVRH